MRTTFFSLLCLGMFLVSCNRTEVANIDNNMSDSVLRHVVLFSFTDSTSQSKISQIEQEFAQLPIKVETIADFEYGLNNSPEDKAQGFTHCFLLTFASEKDRDAYLIHPAHKAFGQLLRPHLTNVLVIDYWTRR